MLKDAERLIFLLAASGFSGREIHESLKAAEEMGADRVHAEILAARRQRGARLEDLPPDMQANQKPGSDWERRRSRVADEIIRLLQKEAHLSAQDAADRLLTSFVMKGKAPHVLPAYRPKDGFRIWLIRLANVIGPSELLHHATRVRNAALELEPPDWPLRERDK
jgi:hypothetical protein